MGEKMILALDQGTTSSRAVLFDAQGNIRGMGQREFTQIYPAPGLVEHNAKEIWETQLFAMRRAAEQAGAQAADIAAIGITNQRETVVAWDAETGEPAANAIVWQCRRTAPECERLKSAGMEPYIHGTTGLIVDPYFSGTKMKWMLENVPAVQKLASTGRLRFGTVDTWLIWQLTKGKRYVTDATNASRTMLFDIRAGKWDEKMLGTFGVPRSALPEVVDSSGFLGTCDASFLGGEIPICGVAGDQHAALFGQCCFHPGMAKNTYGTGCFVLMNTGETPVFSDKGLLTTVAWRIGGKTTYALEGSAFNAGSAIQWLRDELKLIETPQEADRLAETVPDTAGAAFVPAFTGLGAPYWDMYARGALLGVTRGMSKAHLCRAVLESIAYESLDLVAAMEQGSGVALSELRVDGGASRSRFLMQYQADLLQKPVRQPMTLETTALGAAMLAGLAAGIWRSQGDLEGVWRAGKEYLPGSDAHEKAAARWHRAVERSKGWETEESV